MSNRRFRRDVRQQATRADGRSVYGFGVRVGYWPCIHAYFLRIDWMTKIYEFWHGEPSYIGKPSDRFCGTNQCQSEAPDIVKAGPVL